MAAKYIEVPMPWDGEEIGILFCPVCGRKVTSRRHCSHLLFIYFEEAGDFEWVSPSLAEARKRLNLERLENPSRSLAKAIKSDSAVCFYFTPNVTGGGVGVAIEFADDAASA